MDHMVSKVPTSIIVRNTTNADNKYCAVFTNEKVMVETPQKNYHNHFEFYHGPLKYSIYKVKCTKYVYHTCISIWKWIPNILFCTWIINIKYKMFTQKSMLNQKRNLHDLPHSKKGDSSGYWFY